MKSDKKIAILSILLILLAIVFSGCQIRECPDLDENKPIPIGCIGESKYLNNTVVVYGKYLVRHNRTYIRDSSIYFGHVPDTLDVNLSLALNTSLLVDGQTYYFTGIPKWTYHLGSTEYWNIYLQVLDVRKV
jgi:hypothetical protein